MSNGLGAVRGLPTVVAPGQILQSTESGSEWVAASAGGGADLVYNGDFPTNTPYTDGDIVISGGIAYLCVRPTSTAPTPWPQALGQVQPGYGTSFPASPVNGEEFILVDSLTNPNRQWRFRYNASSTSAYKWEFIGGAPYWTHAAANVQASGVSVWTSLTDNVPVVTTPRAGDWLVTGMARASGVATAGGANMGIANAGVSNTPVGPFGSIYLANASDTGVISVQALITGVAVFGSLRMSVLSGVSGLTYDYRTLAVLPVRLS